MVWGLLSTLIPQYFTLSKTKRSAIPFVIYIHLKKNLKEQKMNQTPFAWGQMSGAVEKHYSLGLSLDSVFQSVMLSSMLIPHTAYLLFFKEGIYCPVQMHCLQSISWHRSPDESIYSRVALAYNTSILHWLIFKNCFRSRSVKCTLNVMSLDSYFYPVTNEISQSAALIGSAHNLIFMRVILTACPFW